MLSNVVKKLKESLSKFFKDRKVRWVLISLGIIVSLTGAMIFSYHLAYTQKIFPKIKTGKAELSNLTINQAEGQLNRQIPLDPIVIELSYNNQTWPIDFNELSLAYDVPATAQKAYLKGRGGELIQDIVLKWSLWWKGEEIAMEFSYDKEAFVKVIEEIVGQIEEPVILPRLEIKEGGEIELIEGKNGRLVKKDKLSKLILSNIGRFDYTLIEITTVVAEVQITAEEFKITQERAEKIKDKQINLQYSGKRKSLKGQELIDLIDFHGNFSEEKIASLAGVLAQGVNRLPQNASFNFDGTRVVEFKPSLQGLKLDEESAVILIKTELEALEKTEEKTKNIELKVVVTEPKIKTGEVNDLGIKERLGIGESTFNGSIPSREHNVALTAAKLNGILLAPGEVFSFNQRLGDVSAATGYRQAYIIKGGRTILGDGGGVCQVSTTMFRVALDAGLPIVERRAHAYRVAYYEQNAAAGIDATVYEPSPDFKFKNDTPGHILIQTMVNTGTNYMKIEIYGTSDGRVATISNARIWGQTAPPAPLYQDDPTLPTGTVKQVDWAAWGAKTAFDWKVVRGGEILQQKTFYSNFQPWQAVYLRGIGG